MKTKAKRYPNYITKSWQYRTWIIAGFAMACYFMVLTMGGTGQAIIGVIGSSLMSARMIVMRSRWKKQNKV